jgi:pSer/pThr/pTyr-binding forkhead associated (FHA) protein
MNNNDLKEPYGCLKNESITYLLSNTINKIGRNPLTNTVILNHNSISKEHAIIEFDSKGQGYISDLFSSNGTYVNGIKISSNQKFSLNEGDILKFGKEQTCFKFITNKFSSLRVNNSINNLTINNKLLNSLNKTQLKNNIDPYKSVEHKNLYQSQLLLKNNQLETVNLNYNELRNEYNKLYAKYDALIHYASDLQKKNDLLETEIKQHKKHIYSLENTENGKIITDKEKIIKILQSENNFYSNELRKLKECFNKPDIKTQLELIISEYLLEMENYKKANDIYKEQIHYTDKKWNELIKENDLLKEEVKIINQKWNEDTMRFENIIRENDQRLNNALLQIPMCYNDFNVDKENAAKFLVKEVNLYLNEKKELMDEIKSYKKNVVELINENDRLKDEICQISSKYQDLNVKELVEKNKQLEDSLYEMKQINDVNKSIDYEKIILNLNKEINDYKSTIDELNQKIKIFMGEN